MNKLIRSFWGLGFLGVVGCAAGVGGSRTPAAAVAPATRTQAPHAVAARTQGTVASAPPEYHDQSESDRVFIENAERAIGEYSAFLARAGENEEYARAVQRSREQIEDLQAAIDFVRSGAQMRAFRQH
jgi:hypothetical protein